MWKQIAAISGAVSLVVLVWEHLAYEHKWRFVPSAMLLSVATAMEDAFYELGRWAAYLSSFLETGWYWLKKLVPPASRLLLPVWRMTWSFLNFISGYLYEAFQSTYAHPWCIPIGSILFLSLLAWLLYRKRTFLMDTRVVKWLLSWSSSRFANYVDLQKCVVGVLVLVLIGLAGFLQTSKLLR